MTETTLTPSELAQIEHEAKPDRHYDSGVEGYNEGYIAAAVPLTLLLKQERERSGKLLEALNEIKKFHGLYHKANGNNPAANHLNNIATEVLNQYNQSI